MDARTKAKDINMERKNTTTAMGPARKTTVAYAVTITKYSTGSRLDPTLMYDRAAILHQSIKLAMSKSNRYDYHLYAFVHPDAIEVKQVMEQFGYRVQVRETPFNVSHIQNHKLIKAQNNGCCGEKVSNRALAEQKRIRIVLCFVNG